MTARSASSRAAPAGVAEDPHALEPLETTVQLPDGRVFEGAVPAWRHRRLHLGLLHDSTHALFEIGHGYRAPGGKTRWNSRWDEENYKRGGGYGDPAWLDDALAYISRLCRRPRREIAIGPAARREAVSNKSAVLGSRWLWFDVDEPEYLHRLHAFLERHPAHLHIESAGSGGEHAYWQLATPQRSVVRDPVTGEEIEWIERAHDRLAEHIGVRVTIDGRSVLRGADRVCKDRSRVMRLAGTRNYKTGKHARVISAKLAVAPYTLDQLVGHLPDPPEMPVARPRRFDALPPGSGEDPYKRIAAVEYFERMTGTEINRSGLVRCPMPHHEDRDPSCSVMGPNPFCWSCKGCGEGGAIYDLASVLLGGPTRSALRDEHFLAAKDLVIRHFGRLN